MAEIRDAGTIMRNLTKIFRSILASMILSGALFLPLHAVEASFFSSLFAGDRVLADTSANVNNDDKANTVTPPQAQTGSNSQNLDLLQANVSSASVFQDKNSKDNVKDNTINDINASTDNISENALSPKTGPTGVSGEQGAIDPSCGEPDIYVVKEGDSISKVAKMLGVTESTVLAANNMNKKLVKDDVLFIPSVSGVIHTVTNGQTLQTIAKRYKVDINDITFCNGIAPDAVLAIGDEITIPGGQVVEENVKPTKSITTPKNIQYYETYPAQNLAGFINPVPGYHLSQGLHDGNAVDLAIAKGTPIHAAASGRIIFAKTGYNGGFGYLVIIAHPNGTQTMYGHMSKIIVNAGDQVAQGEIIGNVGSTGHSTGPHVHFVVKGAFNPGANGSWAN